MRQPEGIHLTYLAHLKKCAVKRLENSLFSALIMRLYLLIKLSLQPTESRRDVAIIGTVRDVDKSGRSKSTGGWYRAFANWLKNQKSISSRSRVEERK